MKFKKVFGFQLCYPMKVIGNLHRVGPNLNSAFWVTQDKVILINFPLVTGTFKIWVHLLTQLFYFYLDFNANAIFELPGVDLDNITMILRQLSDLKKLASCTMYIEAKTLVTVV